jgi:DNA replication and repair protein RecF
VEIEPHPDLNVFFGGNGAGKTSILESLVVLARGRSFRTTQAAELVGTHDKQFRVFAETVNQDQKTSRLGLERSGRHWRARKDGKDLAQISQLTRSLPLVLMEPNSHLVVSGPPDVRRKYLDWGMFHVEHEFLDTYRRFAKILKQRNAALRMQQKQVLESIDEVFCGLAQQLDKMRKTHCLAVSEQVKALLQELSPGLSGFDLKYSQGWTGLTIRDALVEQREADLLRGTTSVGPQRGDLSLSFNETPARNLLSRGEQKVLSAALLLSQATILAGKGETPVILLDDLASEFDDDHFENVLKIAFESGGQVWLTGIKALKRSSDSKVFHVEHGLVQEMV